MLRDMSAQEWLHWQVLAGLNAWHESEERADLRAAKIAQALWNVEIAKAQGAWDAAKKKKGARPVFRPISDFIMLIGDIEKPKPPEADPVQRGRNFFQAMVEQFAELGMKPVQR